MLHVPKLDDLDYDRLFARARGKIPTLSGEWTNYNDADPGITVLQAFAWLYDSLNYYLNATGEVHLQKYYKLLGITPHSAAARTVLALAGKGALDLPRGSRFFAGEIPFESVQSFAGHANAQTVFCLEENGALRDLTPQLAENDAFAPVFAPGSEQDSALYFGFRAALGGRVSLFVQAKSEGRNPFEDDFSLVQLQWEWQDGSVWQPAQLLHDETGGLLRSGFVTLALDGTTKPWRGALPARAHYLRCRPAAGSYDAAPQVGGALPCCVRAVQRHSWAHAETALYDGTGAFSPDWCVRAGDLVTVAVGQDGGCSEWFRWDAGPQDLCAVEYSAAHQRVTVRFDEKKYGRVPAVGDRLLVFVLAREAADAVRLGAADGCAGQELAVDAENVETLLLASRQRGADGRISLRLWRRCENLDQAGPQDDVFFLDEKRRVVCFGDALHGAVPPAKAEIEAVQLSTSRFGGGNVRRGQITAADGSADGLEAVFNPEDAAGGTDLPQEAQRAQLLEEKLRAVTRAVTADDYRSLVLATPGLRIDSVAVIPAADYDRVYHTAQGHNTVLLAVKPASAQRLPQLSESYRRIIAAHLEHSRLLTTRVCVVPARYVGVSVYGRIALLHNTPAAREAVQRELRARVETLTNGEYGRRVDLGRLFAGLELLAEVRAVEQLSLEYIGAGGAKNEHGDLLIGPDSLTYLREVGIEFV